MKHTFHKVVFRKLFFFFAALVANEIKFKGNARKYI